MVLFPESTAKCMYNFWSNLDFKQVFARWRLNTHWGICDINYSMDMIMESDLPQEGTVCQKVLAAKKLIFLTNKNNELSAHRLFSATLQLCLNPKKHIPPQSILHEGKDSSSCKSPPSKCQHQPPCIQRKGPRRGRSLTRPNPQQQGTAAVGFQSKNTRGEIFLLCRKGSGIRLAAGPMVLTLFLKVLLALIQLSVTGL